MVESFSDVFRLLSESGGYALIVGLQLILPFILALLFLQWYMKDRSKRMDAREEMERELSQAREAQLRRDYEEQLAREQFNAQVHREDKMVMNETLRMVTQAFGENSAILRQAKGVIFDAGEEIRLSRESRDRNTAVLKQFIPTLPKRASKRKPTATLERTVTVETKATAEGETKPEGDNE